MRKFTLILASMFLTLGTWAQTVVTTINTERSYTLQCKATDHTGYIGVTESGEINGRSDIAAYITFEETSTSNGYYIKVGGKYINGEVNGDPITADAEAKTVWILNAPSHTSDVVTFSSATNYYLNNNYKDASPFLKTNYHNGGPGSGNACSLWVMTEYDVAGLKENLNTLIGTVSEFLAKGYECDEVTTLGTELNEAQAVYDDANATVDGLNAAVIALTEAYDNAKEYPFVESLLKDIESGYYNIYYTDENDVNHYLQTSGVNSVVTVTENAALYEVAAGTVSGGKYTKAYALKMNNLYISNTSNNATNIETKDNVQLWTSQVVFEKDGKCAIRLTNAKDVNGWHGNYLIGKDEEEGATVALDPTTSLEEAMFIWRIEKVDPVDLTYTLTDELGNTYTGSYQGVAGTTLPLLTGVAGYTLEGEWNENSFVGSITFPFPVSSAEVTNETMIASFASASYKWYAEGTNISTKKNVEPSVYEISSYQWAIYPKFSEGAFTFTIKNVGTGKYVYSTSNSNNHDAGVVYLEEEGSALTVEADNRFKLETGKYLSLNSTTGADGTQQYVGTWSGHGGCNTSFPELTAYTVTITDAKAATLTTPFAVSLPEGVTAGYVSGVDTEKQTLEYTDVTTIPAGESVVLFGEAGTYTFDKVAEADAFGTNYLVGYSEATDIPADQTVYALGNKSNGVAFYTFTGTAYAAGKAYLQLPAATQAIGYFNVFGGEGTTGIEAAVNGEQTVVIYDLSGRRVEKMEKGIYIVNGKKVIR